MIVETSRRGFITGAAALFAAPAIVKASSLMPVKMIYYERFLAGYLIGTDEILLRGDKAQFELPVPRYSKTLSRADVERVSPEFLKRFALLKPQVNEQLYVDFVREHYSSDHGWLI